MWRWNLGGNLRLPFVAAIARSSGSVLNPRNKVLQPHDDIPMTTPTPHEQSLKAEIARLETQLSNARAKLARAPSPTPAPAPASPLTPLHPLLLLSDSALPLGSFAFSSGLESYLAHHPQQPHRSNPLPAFLSLSLHSLATTTLPYLLAAYRTPLALSSLDAELDACTLCPVARRASVAQGRALLTLWERAFRGTTVPGAEEAVAALEAFGSALRSAPGSAVEDIEVEVVSGHFAPLWAVVTRAMGVLEHESAYTFLFNHAKAVVSAGVRKGVMGPYAAQGILGGGWLKEEVERGLRVGGRIEVEDAGQGVPGVDLWLGRHEVIYSRIFNS